jgi:hypothetical protein
VVTAARNPTTRNPQNLNRSTRRINPTAKAKAVNKLEAGLLSATVRSWRWRRDSIKEGFFKGLFVFNATIEGLWTHSIAKMH